MPSQNPNIIKTRGLVLGRTNYGEADRILNLLTERGRLSTLARSARRERSKLAGGIELFCVSEFVIHFKNSQLGILSSARPLEIYHRIMTDFDKIELASRLLKRSYRISEQIESGEFFPLLHQALASLDQGLPSILIEVWFLLNFARVSGEVINFVTDDLGQQLLPTARYMWRGHELSLVPHGNLTASHIKLLRLILTHPLATLVAIKDIENLLPPLLEVARSF